MSKDIPGSCGKKVPSSWKTLTGIGSGGKEWYLVEKGELQANCVKDLREKVDLQKSSEVQQGQVLIGGLSGAGGLACGLGLFPCLVKLVSKFKG